MEKVLKLLKLLPKYEDLKQIALNQSEAEFIISMACKSVEKILRDYDTSPPVSQTSLEIEETCFFIDTLRSKMWENIHTGHFSVVPLKTRQLYTAANFFRIVLNLFSSLDKAQLERCSEILDEALLIGCPQDLYANSELFQSELMTFLNTNLGTTDVLQLPYITPLEHKDFACDIPVLQCPSVEVFNHNHFKTEKPVLLRNTIDHWPALSKWRDLNHIIRVAGNRTVPIEVGSNYSTDDWSQQMMKIRDFLKRQFGEEPGAEVEYLAQHELFEQIPDLKEDIRVPDYCCLGTNSEQICINAWLGPKGTISPMHHDIKHNLLCQVFGMKRVILAAPEDTEFLYPHETEFLSNTSQINAEAPDTDQFPLVQKAKFYHLTLQEGECLYIPPKWWHYVRSEAKSFSVSFWWQ